MGHSMLMNAIDCNVSPLWLDILYRDNCTRRPNGSYFKDLSLLNRNMSAVMMVDNIEYNFENFEHNGLPVCEYWGHCNDAELPKLCHIVRDIVCSPSNLQEDVRAIYHALAFEHKFITFKLDNMLRRITYIPAIEMDDSVPNDEVYEMEMDESSESTNCSRINQSDDSIPSSLESASIEELQLNLEEEFEFHLDDIVDDVISSFE